MKIYGLEKKYIDLIKDILEKYLANKLDATVFLFGSRSTGKQKEFSDIDLTLKMSGEDTEKIISNIKSEFEDSDLPYKVDLVNWDELAKEYLPNIKQQKIPFWSPREIDQKSPWRICPIGKHWTRSHSRKLKNGTLFIQSGHCKANSSGKDILKGEEIESIPTLEIFKKSEKPHSNDLGFPYGNKYDELIAGWTAYWNFVFKPNVRLEPNIVKALIATESSFIETASIDTKVKKLGKARGLIQITDSTLSILSDPKQELKDHFIIIKKEDLLDANKNLAAGIRWLFRKQETARSRLKRAPSWEEVLWEYKGITLDKSKKATEIKSKINHFLEILKAGEGKSSLPAHRP